MGALIILNAQMKQKTATIFLIWAVSYVKNGTTTCRQGETKIPNKCVYKGWDQLCRDGNPLGLEKCPECVGPAGLGNCTGCILYYCKQGYPSCCDVSIVSYCKDASFLSNCTYPNGIVPSKNLCTSDKDCENNHKCKLCPPLPHPSRPLLHRITRIISLLIFLSLY